MLVAPFTSEAEDFRAAMHSDCGVPNSIFFPSPQVQLELPKNLLFLEIINIMLIVLMSILQPDSKCKVQLQQDSIPTTPGLRLQHIVQAGCLGVDEEARLGLRTATRRAPKDASKACHGQGRSALESRASLRPAPGLRRRETERETAGCVVVSFGQYLLLVPCYGRCPSGYRT
jgi:hypothetical protein